MSPARRLFAGELVLAVLLLIAALAVDFLWVRPPRDELHRLAARKQAAELGLRSADDNRDRERAVLNYVNAVDSTGWQETYRGGNPLTLLEDMRKQARLRSLDVSLDNRETIPPFERTTYFMSVRGSFQRQMSFLKALEVARPLVTVDAFTMDTREADAQVTLRLNMTVLTLASETGR